MELSKAKQGNSAFNEGSRSSLSGKTGKTPGRIRELELLRAIAIGAVVLIHATASATVELPPGSRTHLLYLILNRMNSFAVPVFIMLSGIVLFYRYYNRWNMSEAFSFYRKRLQYIVIPYVLWSLFYSLFNPWFFKTSSTSAWSWEVFLDQLLWGTTSYHLYFMVIIIQLYVIFPVLIALVNRFALFVHLLPVIGLAVQAAAYSYRYYGGGLSQSASLAVTYAFVFAFGGWIGIHYDRFRRWLDSYSWVATALAVGIGSAYTLLHIVSLFDIRFGWEAEAALFHLYGLTATVGFIVVCRYILNQWPRLNRVLLSIGGVSFGIYFVHPAFLSVFRTYLTASPGSLEYHALTIGGFFAVLLLSWGFSRGLKPLYGSWIILGK